MKFTKYEAVGMFASVGIMAIALFFFRLDMDILAQNGGTDQTASVIDSQDSVEERLEDAYAGGQLSDLVIEDVRVGTGAGVEKGDTVEVHYEGRLQDGTRFDSSYARGETYTFKVGDGKVIAGWEEGILGMQEGGERILVVPPRLAYGNYQVGVIPPNSPLVFMVELIDIK